MTENTDVVVLGGGYAGVMAAHRLTQRDDVALRLINPRPSFVERIRLHQLVRGSDDAVADDSDVLSADVKLVVDAVTGIDPGERTVALASGGAVGYDHLIYTVGSGSAASDGPGVVEFAFPLTSMEEATRLRQAVEGAARRAAVTVVGAGPSGIETTGEQPGPVNVGFAGQCISLGRRAGLFQFAHKNDDGTRLDLGGRPGATLKEFVCSATVKQLSSEAHQLLRATHDRLQERHSGADQVETATDREHTTVEGCVAAVGNHGPAAREAGPSCE